MRHVLDPNLLLRTLNREDGRGRREGSLTVGRCFSVTAIKSRGLRIPSAWKFVPDVKKSWRDGRVHRSKIINNRSV